MHRSLVVVLVVLAVLSGCKKSSSASGSAKSGDAVQQQLQQDAGGGASDCGRLSSQAPDQLKKASDCAMQAAQSKKPFYVAYDMPGMTVGVAGNSEGKLFYVSSQQPGPTGATPEIKNGPCEAELRIAGSGRVTCFAPGSMGPMGGSPHAGAMPPGMESPHAGGMTMPPPGTPNPHQGGAMGSSHGSTAPNPPKQ